MGPTARDLAREVISPAIEAVGEAFVGAYYTAPWFVAGFWFLAGIGLGWLVWG